MAAAGASDGWPAGPLRLQQLQHCRDLSLSWQLRHSSPHRRRQRGYKRPQPCRTVIGVALWLAGSGPLPLLLRHSVLRLLLLWLLWVAVLVLLLLLQLCRHHLYMLLLLLLLGSGSSGRLLGGNVPRVQPFKRRRLILSRHVDDCVALLRGHPRQQRLNHTLLLLGAQHGKGRRREALRCHGRGRRRSHGWPRQALRPAFACPSAAIVLLLLLRLLLLLQCHPGTRPDC